ncbi:MAG: hypothetical protein V7K83_05215, partial [Nostoc sp.]
NERPYFSYLGRCLLRIYLSLHSLVFSCLLTYLYTAYDIVTLSSIEFECPIELLYEGIVFPSEE